MPIKKKGRKDKKDKQEKIDAYLHTDSDQQSRGGSPEMLTSESIPSTASSPTPLTLEDIGNVIKLQVDRIKEEWRADLTQLGEVVLENVERIEEKIECLDVKVEEQEIIMESRLMEFAIRIRGWKEARGEDLEMEIAMACAGALGCAESEIYRDIDRVYRVNSWVAKNRGLPKDVVAYFTKRSLRNQIVQAFYNQKFKIGENEVIILKELPAKFLKIKKQYSFLADELKKKQIRFRWEIPKGMVVNFQGVSKKVDTVEKAREFYRKLMGVDPQINQEGATASEVGIDTRVDQIVNLQEESSEPMGGARPKTSKHLDDVLRQLKGRK